jgi:4-hydroxy-3-polyprenylbenzoate decarboxylase
MEPIPGDEKHRTRHLVVAVTGASGAIYAVRLLKACLELGIDIDLVVSDYGKRLLIEECDLNLRSESFADWLAQRSPESEIKGELNLLNCNDLGASVASGSVRRDGMIVIPCSMKTLSGIACGRSSTLIERAADVTLKERRPLVLVPRETPLNLIQLENMTRAARAGASILPAMPAFYYGPRNFDDLADFIAGRVLSLLDIPHRLFQPWKGEG